MMFFFNFVKFAPDKFKSLFFVRQFVFLGMMTRPEIYLVVESVADGVVLPDFQFGFSNLCAETRVETKSNILVARGNF